MKRGVFAGAKLLLTTPFISAPMGITQIFLFIKASGMQTRTVSDVHGGRCHEFELIPRQREAQMNLTVESGCRCVSGSQSRCFPRANQRHYAAGEEACRQKTCRAAGPHGARADRRMKQQFQGQIDGLKSDLATKDAQLQQAQQTAADAQAAAAKAEADAQRSSRRPPRIRQP